MIYLIILALATIFCMYKACKDPFIETIGEYIAMLVLGLCSGILIGVIVINIAIHAYNGGVETIVVETDNPDVILIQEVYTDREYCDRWIFGAYVYSEEMQYVENKKGE